MTVVIHQPDFLPHLGFFQRFLHADLWVVLDNVQFLTRGWHHRDKIKSPGGERWVSVAVRKASRQVKINEVYLSTTVDWRAGNLNLISENYRKAPFFKEVFPYIEELYNYKCERLMEFNLKSIEMLMTLFDIGIERKLASSLKPAGKANHLLVDILKKTGADVYLSGTGARDYYDPLPFEEAGIKVIWQDFTHPVYPQLHGEFIPYLSSIDLFFNCGIERSREILRSLSG